MAIRSSPCRQVENPATVPPPKPAQLGKTQSNIVVRTARARGRFRAVWRGVCGAQCKGCGRAGLGVVGPTSWRAGRARAGWGQTKRGLSREQVPVLMISAVLPRVDALDLRGDLHVQTVNSRHSRLKDFLRPRRGIATRYLDNYLSLIEPYCNPGHRRRRRTCPHPCSQSRLPSPSRCAALLSSSLQPLTPSAFRETNS